jgi:hypothetical protein
MVRGFGPIRLQNSAGAEMVRVRRPGRPAAYRIEAVNPGFADLVGVPAPGTLEHCV